MDLQWCNAAPPGPMIHSWQTNGAGQDCYNGYPSQVVHDHWNPNETCISFSWSEVNKLPLERNAAVLRNGAAMVIQWCHEASPDPAIYPWKINGAGHAWINRRIFNILVLTGNPNINPRIGDINPHPPGCDLRGPKANSNRWPMIITKHSRWRTQSRSRPQTGIEPHSLDKRQMRPLRHDSGGRVNGSKNI